MARRSVLLGSLFWLVAGCSSDDPSPVSSQVVTPEILLEHFADPTLGPNLVQVFAQPQWLTNDSLVFSTFHPARGAEIHRIDARSGERSALATGSGHLASPSGQHVSFLSSTGQLAVVTADGSSTWQIPLEGVVTTAAWAPDGSQLAIAVAGPDGTSLHLHSVQDRQSLPLAEVEGSVLSLAWLSAERLAMVVIPGDDPDESGTLARIDEVSLPSGAVRTLISEPQIFPANASLYPSPDGNLLAFHQMSIPFMLEQFSYIAVADLRDSSVRRVSDDNILPSVGSDIYWLPDGQRLLTSFKPGVFEQVGLISLAGEVTLVPGLSAQPLRNVTMPALGPDGSTIAWFSDDPYGSMQIRVGSLEGGEDRSLVELTQLLGLPDPASFRVGAAEVVRWNSFDGLELEGLLIKPLDYEEGQRVPLFVDVHGGPTASLYMMGSILNATSFEWHMLAGRGYAVFVPSYREDKLAGHTPWLEQHADAEYWSRNAADVETGILALVERGLVDPDRVALNGHSAGSRGVANWMAATSTVIQAIITKGGPADETPLYFDPICNDDCREYFDFFYGGSPDEVPERWLRNSSIGNVKPGTTPEVLLASVDQEIHENFTEFGDALRTAGRPVTVAHYPDEEHVIYNPENQVDFLAQVLSLLDRHLGAPR